MENFSIANADATSVAVTIFGGSNGDTAQGTVDTVGGEISGNVTITDAGTDFEVGETVTISEIAGDGAYSATVDSVTIVPAGGGIANLFNFTTTTPFDETSTSGIAVTLSGNATGTGTTFANGELAAINITDGGSGYEVGDTVTITETNGAGEAAGKVESIS